MDGGALVTSEDYTVMSTHEPVEAIPFGNAKGVHESPLHSGMPYPLIQTEQLSLHYGEKPVFADVTLPIHAGCITALLGPSGCGKTSFLSCLNRLTDLIPNCKICGQVRLEDLDILHPKTDTVALRRRVGTIFQKPNPFPLSIWKNIAFPLREHGIKDRQRIDEIVEQVLVDVGLWDEVKDRLKSPALRLSGGQKQRLCIARTLDRKSGSAGMP